LELLGEESKVIRHDLPGPQALKDLEGRFRQLVKMPLDDPHVRDPGVHRDKVVICIPGSIGVANNVLSPQLGDLCVRMRLGVRKELWKERKRERYKDTPPESANWQAWEKKHLLRAWASVSMII
jgi:hypothetical protein